MNSMAQLSKRVSGHNKSYIAIRSPLKWAGGKRKLVPSILKQMPRNHSGKLIEPFVGGGSVFLNTHFDEYALVDSNKDLISFFHFVKNDVQHLIKSAKQLFIADNNDAAKYYAFRKEFNAIEFGLRRACLFIYLNRYGYNGLCRYNRQGGFNVPFGSYKKPYFPEQEILHMSNKLQHAQFKSGDFADAFGLAKPGDVIYCDPPYSPVSATSSFTAYSGEEFAHQEQERLAALAVQARNKGVTTIISNHKIPITIDLYRLADKLVTIDVARSINCKGKKRKTVKELLAVYKAAPHIV